MGRLTQGHDEFAILDPGSKHTQTLDLLSLVANVPALAGSPKEIDLEEGLRRTVASLG